MWTYLKRVCRQYPWRVGMVIAGIVPPLYLLFLAVSVYTYSFRDDARQADAAIVLGAAVFGNRPSPVLRERINHAIDLYQQGTVDYLIFTGGQGHPAEPAESIVSRNYALQRGVPAEAILIEDQSTTTIENLTYAQMVGQEHQLQTYLIVSTPFHMKRAVAIAHDLGMDANTSPTRTTRWISFRTRSRSFVREVLAYGFYVWWQ